jgi:hypothetical protein
MLAPSMAPISKVAASLMRKPQEYMSAKGPVRISVYGLSC